MKTPASNPDRRQFLKQTALAAGAGSAFSILGCKKTPSSDIFVGEGKYEYEVFHDWAKLPDQYTWQTSHNVAVDADNQLYVIHEGLVEQPDHPSIFVFDEDGVFVKAFGSQFQGGGHGLEVRTEGSEQFLYVTGYQHLKNFAKLTLEGEVVWEHHAPMDAGGYADGEADKPEKTWGRDRFMPTNFAFADDGGFYLADGYGSYRIHRYDADANYVSSFGSPGKEDGQFNLPHGVWIDARPGREASVVVADRANARLQWFTLAGEHLKTMEGFILPANIDAHEDTLLVPDLSARITLLDGDDNLIHLGEDASWREAVLAENKAMRRTPDGWQDGKFVHPHDACFDPNGNIFVAEWVQTGRVTKMRRVA